MDKINLKRLLEVVNIKKIHLIILIILVVFSFSSGLECKDLPYYKIFFDMPSHETAICSKNRIIDEINNCISHPNFISGLMLSNKPVTAVIVGSGTTGIESVVYAVNNLPKRSNIVLFQYTNIDPDDLCKLLSEHIPGAKDYSFYASPAYDIGELNKIRTFMEENRDLFEATKLYIHTADKAQRYIPDAMPIDAVISQVVRRASVTLISEYIDRVSSEKSILKILLSSDCALNRSDYIVPNLGPYQIGKVIGDELFRTSNRKRDTSIAVIVYLGGTTTHGQVSTRLAEYELLKNHHPFLKDVSLEEFIEMYSVNDIPSMDSNGFVLKKIFEAAYYHELKEGSVYSIYGPSINSVINAPIGILEEDIQAPLIRNPLEE